MKNRGSVIENGQNTAADVKPKQVSVLDILVRFSCLRKYRRLDAFFITSDTCMFQERLLVIAREDPLLVIVTPSNLMWSTTSRLWQKIYVSLYICHS